LPAAVTAQQTAVVAAKVEVQSSGTVLRLYVIFTKIDRTEKWCTNMRVSSIVDLPVQ
jgi:hypothetical protein